MYSVLKQHVDSAGNVGYIFEQSYSGNDAGVIALMQSLIAGDGVPRFAQLAETTGLRDIQPS